MERVLATLGPWVERGIPVVGLEPSCLLTLRDELGALLPGAESDRMGKAALLFEELLAADGSPDEWRRSLGALRVNRLLVHGHCHQKAFGAMGAVETVLNWIPDLRVDVIPAGCCGMAGAFGYEAEHYELSMAMAERELLPAVWGVDEDVWLAADGTSCRRQIADGAGREAWHVARVVGAALG